MQTRKRSKQREKIFQVLKRTRSHPTAEWVYERVREQMPHISLGTVYRNLNILKEQGKIREIDFGEGHSRYDAFVDAHYHFVCEQCGAVADIEAPVHRDLSEQLSVAVPGKVRMHRLDFFGVCSSCLAREDSAAA